MRERLFYQPNQSTCQPGRLPITSSHRDHSSDIFTFVLFHLQLHVTTLPPGSVFLRLHKAQRHNNSIQPIRQLSVVDTHPADPIHSSVIAQHGVRNFISGPSYLCFLTTRRDLDPILRGASKADIFSPCRRTARLRHSIRSAWEVSSSHLRTPPLQPTLLRQNTEVIREKVQDGVTGETKDLQYTQCKIVGNGSFGVVFQTKLSPSGEDAAIKRVLQDKRFKASLESLFVGIEIFSRTLC